MFAYYLSPGKWWFTARFQPFGDLRQATWQPFQGSLFIDETFPTSPSLSHYFPSRIKMFSFFLANFSGVFFFFWYHKNKKNFFPFLSAVKMLILMNYYLFSGTEKAGERRKKNAMWISHTTSELKSANIFFFFLFCLLLHRENVLE